MIGFQLEISSLARVANAGMNMQMTGISRGEGRRRGGGKDCLRIIPKEFKGTCLVLLIRHLERVDRTDKCRCM